MLLEYVLCAGIFMVAHFIPSNSLEAGNGVTITCEQEMELVLEQQQTGAKEFLPNNCMVALMIAFLMMFALKGW